MTRLYILADDIGVTSEAILDKCLAAGMELKRSHRTPLTAEQVKFIRELFNKRTHKTNLEIDKPIDLKTISNNNKKTDTSYNLRENKVSRKAPKRFGSQEVQHSTNDPINNPGIYVDFQLPASAKAIDIESDGGKIFEFGYSDSNHTHSVKENSKILEEIIDFEKKSKSSWIIGHNILAWDIPVIRKICARDKLFSNNPIWDTLLISWLLEPWKTTHALQVYDNAHHAGEDAKAAFKLFESQFNKLPNGIKQKHHRKPRKDIVELFLEAPDLLSEVENRKYPKFNIQPCSKLTILPEAMLRDAYWCMDIKYLWPQGYNNRLDDCFNPKEVQDHQPQNEFDKIAKIIIINAAKNNVQVLVRMIPAWLRECISGMIQVCATINTFDESINLGEDRTVYISSYKAFSENGHSFWFGDERLNCISPTEGLLESCVELKSFSSHEIETEYGLKSYRETLLPITEKSPFAGMIDRFDRKGSYWLHYNPCIMLNPRREPWTIWQVPQLIISESAKSQAACKIITPKWVYAGSKIEFVEDMVWPSSINRYAYWQDTLRKLWSVVTASKDQFVILCVNGDDIQSIQDILVSAGLTVDSKLESESCFRQCEHIKKSGKRLAVCSVSRCGEWIEAALAWHWEPVVVIDSVPLAQWWMCLHSKDIVDSEYWSSKRKTTNSTADSDTDDQEKENDEGLWGSVDDAQMLNNLQDCSDKYLVPWINSVTRVPQNTLQVVLLDSRIKNLQSSQCAVHEYPYIELSNEIKKSLNNSRHKLGVIDRKLAPIEYADYQKFLKDYWGYEDFKDHTQKPAMVEIMGNNKDVLVRLPTGEGKSVLFQVPALLRGLRTQRLTVVITPLRALMRDQVSSLWEKKFYQSVDYLSGDREIWETDEVYQGIIDNRIKLLFVAPERFRVQRFKDALYRRIENDEGLEYVVFDEAHCISQWGFQFRPDYLFAVSEIRNLRKSNKLQNTSILMFSATVTDSVRKDLYSETGTENMTIKPDNYLHPIQDFISIYKEDMALPLYNRNLEQDTRISERVGFIENIIRKAKLDLSTIIIFVSRREHAEVLANCLSDKFDNVSKEIFVRYFHAGLPSNERLHIYEELKQGQVNVLVCTKAFGMGMDISNIHWCVHLAPPNCLEDYLQEVGRTGRDPKSRSNAALDKVKCYLLANPSDFSKNHELIQENKIEYVHVRELWLQLYQKSQVIVDSNLRLCVIPTDEKLVLSGNRLRNGLFWLERFGWLKIAAYVPSFLPVKLNFASLGTSSAGESSKSRVAKAILKIYEQWDNSQRQTAVREETENQINADYPKENIIISAIKSFIGFLFGGFTQNTVIRVDPQPNTVINHRKTPEPAQLNISNLLKEAKLRRVEELYTALYQLEKEEAIDIIRNIKFEKRAYSEKTEILYSWLRQILSRIVVPTQGVCTITIDDLVKELNLTEQEINEDAKNTRRFWNEQTFRATKRYALMAAVKLCGSVQLSLTEKHENGVSFYSYDLPQSKCDKIKKQIENIIDASQIMLKKLIEDDSGVDKELSFSELIGIVTKNQKIRISHLKAAVKLLSNLVIYHTSQPLIPYSYVLEILKEEPFTEHNNVDNLDSLHPNRMLNTDLDRVNKMTELRSYAFELFSMLPPEQIRDFIDRYFAAGSVEDLNNLLESSVKLVDDKKLNGQLQQILQRVRKEAVCKEFELLKNGEEPEQYKACISPYNRNLLINAGPGAGKTHVLLTRAVHLIEQQGIKPWQILILAFNRAIVHEIRTRIKELFDKLGYGGYAATIKIFTFHAYALSNLRRYAKEEDDRVENEQAERAENNDGNPRNSKIEKKWNKFVELFALNSAFRAKVAEDIKVVMVDEFQDMDDSRYDLIKAFSNTGANLTVIGDDDQDILRWDRESKKEAFEYFEKFKQEFEPDVINLRVNFRSGRKIVRGAQLWLNRRNLRRTKQGLDLTARQDSPVGQTDSQFTKQQLQVIAETARTNNESLAILCRKNIEAANIYRELKSYFPDLILQGKTNVELSWTRSVGKWIDCCNNFLEQNKDGLFTKDHFDEIHKMYLESGIAEEGDITNPYNILWLWQTSLRENPYLKIKEHIVFLEDLTIDDYMRMYGKENQKKEIIVSTIHKVKGLEFDTVCILSSDANFPLRNNGDDIQKCSADEIRSYYVAMTRAKTKLYLEWGDRERKWTNAENFAGDGGGQQSHLSGSLKEIYISEPGFDEAQQAYLEKHVKIGDRIVLSNGILTHNERQIARLSRDTVRNIVQGMQLYVSEVIRYPITPETLHYVQIVPVCKERGWLYVPLISE